MAREKDFICPNCDFLTRIPYVREKSEKTNKYKWIPLRKFRFCHKCMKFIELR